MSGPGVLGAIIADTRRRLATHLQQAGVRDALERRAAAARPRGDRFASALGQPGRTAVIGECKRRSPSRGLLRAGYAPAELAGAYERAGAAAISVVTEPTRFGGALEHLADVRAAVRLPLLRKDFIVDELQLLEARAAGADAVLLITAALADAELRNLHVRAGELGLAALVEVHDRTELKRAVAAGAGIIGVNNRDLRTLAVDLAVSLELAAHIPADAVAVSESGICSVHDVEVLRAAGYHAVLVGERLVTDPDPGAALAALLAGAP